MKFENVGIFFDRDGTINTEVDFLSDPDDLELIPGAARVIHEANTLGTRVFVITNQSGIARGFLSESELHSIHERLTKLLAKEKAHVDAIYYCPHYPDSGASPYNIVCDCRKPRTGMLTRARDEFHIDLAKSYVVGDRCVDIMAGEKAGCTTILVLTGYGTAEKEECLGRARVDYVAADVKDAWKYIKKDLSQREAEKQTELTHPEGHRK